MISFWWQYFFIFHHAPSVWTCRLLRLSWQQLFSIFNWLLLLLFLLPISWIMLLYISSKHLACIPSLQSLILHPGHLCSHKWLLPPTNLFSVKYFMQTKFRSEFEITLKRLSIIFTLVSSKTSTLNWKENTSKFSLSPTCTCISPWNFHEWVLITEDMTGGPDALKKQKWKF